METRYLPDKEFVTTAIKLREEGKAKLENIEGHMRWVITDGDGTYILRPISAKPTDDHER